VGRLRAFASVLVVLALGAGLGACASPDEPSAPSSPQVAAAPEPPPKPQFVPSLVALARVPAVAVYDSPSSPTPSRNLSNPTAERYPLAFRVEARQGDWLKVFLPVRPNGAKGWIKSSQVALGSTRFRVVIELAAHRARVYDGDNLIMEEVVGVGTARYPTPTGDFYIDAVVKTGNPQGVYGPYQLSVAGFSNVLTRFAGGPGQIALHGTNSPRGLGTNVSHGCVRFRNEAITRMANTLPVGTPVQILP
jgi:lipoprotein-anchoring transpeptidase ErfK/SrfK